MSVTSPARWRLRGAVGPALRRGLLTAAPVGVALLLDLESSDEVAGAIATAALLAGFVAFDAPARIRFRWQLLFAPALGLAGALGALSSGSDLLAVFAMTASAGAAGLLVAVSPRLAIAGMIWVLGLLLAQALAQSSDREAGEVALLAIAGGLLQALFALIAWALSDREREDFDLAAKARAAARALGGSIGLGSHAFRHALRWGVALGAGVAVYRFTGLDHGYWIPLTILFVLKAEPDDTNERMAMRAAGTIAGLVLATGLAEALGGNPVAVTIALTLAAACTYALLAIQYALFTTAVTIFVVLLTDSLGAPAIDTAGERGLATAIGIAIAACAFLAWPNPDRDP